MAFLPEDKARDRIDAMLASAGWSVQDSASANIGASTGVAVREFVLKKGHGTADYLLYVNRAAVGVIEAKREGEPLTGVEVQTEKYSVGLPDTLPAVHRPLPFLFQSTGTETKFTNLYDPTPVSRSLFAYLRPETLQLIIDNQRANRSGMSTAGGKYDAVQDNTVKYTSQTLLGKLRRMPELFTEGMRDCQAEAIHNLEQSLSANRPRALIQMQTGSGKTYMAVAQAYRLIKFADATRILFLVDRNNLAKQTLGEFQNYVCPNDGRKFTELYNVQWLQSNKIDPAAKVVITTIQRLYSILKGEEEFDAANEEEPLAGLAALRKDPLPVAYNPDIPIETFDFIFTDEAHRSIYNLWRQVLEYFDAYLVGLTATPSKATLGFFNRNLVMEYGHAQAVADRVNVDFTVYKILTRVTVQGGKVEAGNVVDKRNRKTRQVRWEELDADLDYTPTEVDRSVVVPDQIRTIVQTFRDKLFTEIFPGRTEVPKTLIFAKDDNHAEEIVRIVREEFGRGNEFCEKITYRTSTVRIVDPNTQAVSYRSSGIKPEDMLSSFRNAYNPRIVVTVDMIATGTDVKPLEIVFFMRDVQSSNYFEQMKGRGCRVMDAADFQAVTPDARNKSHYVIVDAVGVTEHDRRDSVSLERDPSVPLKRIITAVGQGSVDPDVLSTLASRLSRLDNILTPGQRQEIERIAGRPIGELVHALVDSVEPDVAVDMAESRQVGGGEDPGLIAQIEHDLRAKAAEPFLNPELRQAILQAQQDLEQTIDTVTADEVLVAGASAEATEKARTTIDSFRVYIEEHKDELVALQLLYSRRRGLAPTLAQLKELARTLGQPPRAWTPEALWRAYETLEKSKVRGAGGKVVTDLVSLVRFALEQESILRPFGETVHDRYAAWLSSQAAAGRTFTDEERRWLDMIRDHIATSMTIEPADFSTAPLVQAGGLGKAYQVFGGRLQPLLAELNEVLAA